jgi:hypothetical protein
VEQRHETARPQDYMEPREFVELVVPAIARSPLSTICAGSGPERPETGKRTTAQGFVTGIRPHTSVNTEREKLINARAGVAGSKWAESGSRPHTFVPFSSFFSLFSILFSLFSIPI